MWPHSDGLDPLKPPAKMNYLSFIVHFSCYGHDKAKVTLTQKGKQVLKLCDLHSLGQHYDTPVEVRQQLHVGPAD